MNSSFSPSRARAWARPAACILACAVLARPAAAQGTNVALNKPVSLLAGSATSSNTIEGYNRITDGVFGVDGAPYTVNSVSWTGTSTFFGIALGGPFTLTGFQVQADDNDTYLLEYRNGTSGAWMAAYTVPVLISSTGIGASTRPFYMLTTPIQATDLRISATGGDNIYALMQVEAFAAPAPTTAPEPATWALLAGGLGGVGVLARRRRA